MHNISIGDLWHTFVVSRKDCSLSYLPLTLCWNASCEIQHHLLLQNPLILHGCLRQGSQTLKRPWAGCFVGWHTLYMGNTFIPSVVEMQPVPKAFHCLTILPALARSLTCDYVSRTLLLMSVFPGTSHKSLSLTCFKMYKNHACLSMGVE